MMPGKQKGQGRATPERVVAPPPALQMARWVEFSLAVVRIFLALGLLVSTLSAARVLLAELELGLSLAGLAVGVGVLPLIRASTPGSIKRVAKATMILDSLGVLAHTGAEALRTAGVNPLPLFLPVTEAGLKYGLPGALTGAFASFLVLAGESWAAARVALTPTAGVLLPSLPAMGLTVASALAAASLVDRVRRRSEVVLELLSSLALISRAEDPGEALQSLARQARGLVGALWTAVYLPRGADLVVAASNGMPEGYPKELLGSLADPLFLRSAPTSRALQEKAAFGYADVERALRGDPEARALLERFVRPFGFGAIYVFPLLLGPEALGVLAIYFRNPRRLRASEVEALEYLASQAAVVLARTRLAQAEREARRRQEEAEETKRAVLVGISHELRTPVTAVLGLAETLLDHWGRLEEAERRGLLEKLQIRSLQMARLTEAVLVSLGAARPRPRLLSLREEVLAAIREAGERLGRHALRVEIPEGLGVAADPDHLRTVLSALLDNAVSYSEPGTEVVVGAEELEGEVRLFVQDRGPGVPDDLKEQVFAPFWRGEDALLRTARGAGLGLTLARSLTEAMGGRIWLEDAQPRGTKAVVALARTHPPPS